MNPEESFPSSNNYSILEKRPSKKEGGLAYSEDRVSPFNEPVDPYTLKSGEYNDVLEAATRRLLKPEVYRDIVDAYLQKHSHGRVAKFTILENSIIEACLNLKDDDIESIIRKLHQETAKIVNSYLADKGVTGQIREGALQQRWKINSVGIRSVIEYVRERYKFLITSPAQSFVIGFNSLLDEKMGIDLIEIIFTGIAESEMNLIQVKSSVPSGPDQEHIYEEHRKFINLDTLKYDDIEAMQPTEEDIADFELILRDHEAILERIFDTCADYKDKNFDKLEAMIGISDYSIAKKAALLSSHIEFIENTLKDAVSEGYVESQSAETIINDLKLLAAKYTKDAGIPQNVIKISRVNSVITVGKKEIAKRTIKTNTAPAIAMK
jgi:hypothetical protein